MLVCLSSSLWNLQKNCDRGSLRLPRIKTTSPDCTHLSDLLGEGDCESCCPVFLPVSCYHGNAAHPDITPGVWRLKFLDLKLVSILYLKLDQSTLSERFFFFFSLSLWKRRSRQWAESLPADAHRCGKMQMKKTSSAQSCSEGARREKTVFQMSCFIC